MTRTCIINLSTGLVENIVEMGMQPPAANVVEHIEAPQGYLYVASDTARIAATYANGVFTDPPPLPAVTVRLPPSPREWLERLSPQKQAAIAAGGIANAQILLWLLKAAGATAINVTLQETKDGVAALVAAGILSADDQAILLAP
jgi:hypothetical protein